MLLFEIKKVLSRPAHQGVLVFLVILFFVICSITIGSVEYVDQEGNKTSGITAARCLRKEKEAWTGYVTEERLMEVLKENARINASEEYLSKDVRENNKAYSKKQGFSGIRDMINRAFCDFQEYDYYRADSITEEEVGRLYEKRIDNLKTWLEQDDIKEIFSKPKQTFLIEQYQDLKTPFYYAYTDGWDALLTYIPTLISLVVLGAAFFVAGIFSDEYRLKADAVFFSSKLGRSKAVRSKICAGILIITSLYWTAVLLYSAAVLAALGAEGSSCAIQSGFSYGKSFYHLTYFQCYLLTICGGYLGALFVLTISMLVSAKTCSKTLAVTVPFILLLIPSYLTGNSALADLVCLFPGQLMMISETVKFFNLYQIGHRIVGSVPILFILYLLLYGFLPPALYRIYRRPQNIR